MRKTSAPAPAVYLYTLVAVAAGAAYVTLRMAEDRRRPRHSGLDAESIAAAQRINRRLQHDAAF